jgi:hypothetical protein
MGPGVVCWRHGHTARLQRSAPHTHGRAKTPHRGLCLHLIFHGKSLRAKAHTLQRNHVGKAVAATATAGAASVDSIRTLILGNRPLPCLSKGIPMHCLTPQGSPNAWKEYIQVHPMSRKGYIITHNRGLPVHGRRTLEGDSPCIRRAASIFPEGLPMHAEGVPYSVLKGEIES